MAEVSNIKAKQINNSTNIDAHYSSDMKVTKPKVTSYDAPMNLPQKRPFSDKDATIKMQQLNTDIYESYKKEKSKNGFNFSTFLKIFGGISIAAILFACLRKNKVK